jgi:hypothetical protein
MDLQLKKPLKYGIYGLVYRAINDWSDFFPESPVMFGL